MNTKEFQAKVLDKFTESITDRVFLMIQNHPDLKKDYLELLKSNGPHSLNTGIAKAIKSDFNLKNNGECKNPESDLIESYTKFKLK